ncbi:uncharacterized protein BO80DRAFT_210707 [Aspergillus ibericus CBS 121593]|uniref:Uncharacterized protein n=1 Tax=Aspergillus ibericus CBS 121593 TaxID=1448316 RepID=A0A395HBB5_9EURO|nr:hypothetical protein BO80DRAFT_210707 [Aspergillus ibericus CBS 121593]RAL04859.1 hypothetical protein BO80DRAFT_210707 [Aspergillus ibericus CBS 121593]
MEGSWAAFQEPPVDRRLPHGTRTMPALQCRTQPQRDDLWSETATRSMAFGAPRRVCRTAIDQRGMRERFPLSGRFIRLAPRGVPLCRHGMMITRRAGLLVPR